MKEISIEKLEEKCVDLLSTTFISLGQYKHEPETTMLLAKKLARDLKRKKKRPKYINYPNILTF